MTSPLVLTALVMGLAGGPHCIAMCGAACAGVTQAGRGSSASRWLFHGGRIAGYAVAGAAAGLAVQTLAWLASQAAALRPVWTLFHLAVLLWGLALLALARQPAWAGSAARFVWTRARPWVGTRAGMFGAGALWTLMPCGLLYSALLLAGLSAGPLQGALAMALFALGSSLWLAAAPWVVVRLQGAGNRIRQDWGTRLSGLLLVIASTWALSADLVHRVAAWCGLA